jgi:hypothetical protein
MKWQHPSGHTTERPSRPCPDRHARPTAAVLNGRWRFLSRRGLQGHPEGGCRLSPDGMDDQPRLAGLGDELRDPRGSPS